MRESYYGDMWEVESEYGTWYVPADEFTAEEACEIFTAPDGTGNTATLRRGLFTRWYLCHGYLDCSEWEPVKINATTNRRS